MQRTGTLPGLTRNATDLQELTAHAFPWSTATHQLQPCAWLDTLALHSSAGPWQHECGCSRPAASPGAWGAAAPLLRQLWAAQGPVASISRQELAQQLGSWLGLPLVHAPCQLSEVRAGPGAPPAATETGPEEPSQSATEPHSWEPSPLRREPGRVWHRPACHTPISCHVFSCCALPHTECLPGTPARFNLTLCGATRPCCRRHLVRRHPPAGQTLTTCG